MEAFQSARVLVIDDQWDEARLILDLLWKRGISAVYSDGDMEGRVGPKLSGVRLIFLDLQITGPAQDAHQFLNGTIGVLDELVDLTQPGIGIVYWTKHPDKRQQFETLVRERLPRFRPAFLIGQEKLDYIRGNDPAPIQRLAEEISRTVLTQRTHHFLCEWEAAVLAGAISTTSAIAPEGEGEETWLRSLAALAKGAGGSSQPDAEHAVTALCMAMHELLSDAIPPARLIDRVGMIGEELLRVIGDPRITLDAVSRRRLNGLLLLAPLAGGTPASQPGAVVDAQLLPNSADIRPASEDRITQELKDIGQKDQRASDLAGQVRQVFVNVTPPCDAAQDKSPVSRFLGGLLVPVDGQTANLKVPADRRQYARQFPEFAARGLTGMEDGAYWLVVNARMLFTTTTEGAQRQAAFFALRSGAVSDLLNWFAAHASRPGMITV